MHIWQLHRMPWKTTPWFITGERQTNFFGFITGMWTTDFDSHSGCCKEKSHWNSSESGKYKRTRLISCRYFLNVDKRISLHTLYKSHYSADVRLPCGKLRPAEEHLDTILAVLICLASVYSQRYQRTKLNKPKPILNGLRKKIVPESVRLTEVATSSVCPPWELCIRRIAICTQTETVFWLGTTRFTNDYISSLYLLVLCPLHCSLSNQWPVELHLFTKRNSSDFVPV